MTSERNLLDYAYVLIKWRRMIVVSVLLVAAVAAGISLVLPQQWTASTTLLPSEEESAQFGFASVLAANVPPNLGSLIGGSGSSERLLTVLQSRRVLGAMVDSFALVAEYGAPNRDIAMDHLDENIQRELDQDGALTIHVTAANPQLAAALANALAAELDAVNRQCRKSQAQVLREFLDERMGVVKAELAAASGHLRAFQEHHGLVDMEAQTGAVVEVIQGVAQELSLQQVELGLSERLLGPGHEDLVRAELRVEELRRQLRRLVGERETQSGARLALENAGVGPTLMALPELGQEYARLLLEMRVKEAVVSFLGTRLEEMRYKEAKDTPTLLVLDAATTPEFRTAPRRTLIVLGATAVSLVVSVLVAFGLESLGRISAENEERLEAIRSLFRPR
jgi:uncharacterized protein involved in exopolysaccharide biosynthesis